MERRLFYLILSTLFLCFCRVALGAEDGQAVRQKAGEVVKDDKIDRPDEEEMSPDSLETKGDICIIRKILLPPKGGWLFKLFAKSTTHMDLCCDTEGGRIGPAKDDKGNPIDADTKVGIEGTIKKPKDAGSFPLRGEGNLMPPSTGGEKGGNSTTSAPQGWHWSVKILDLKITGVVTQINPIDEKNQLILDPDGNGPEKPMRFDARKFGKYLVYDMSTTPAGRMDPDDTWIISESLTLETFEISKPADMPPIAKKLVRQAIEDGLKLGNATSINLGSQTHPVTEKKLKKNQFMDMVVSNMPDFATEWKFRIRQELFAQTPAGKFRFCTNSIEHSRKQGDEDPVMTIKQVD